tara:strand:- start:2607 stop:3344 length:738 start_codon:yes stop_codon:yes gene_type:complete
MALPSAYNQISINTIYNHIGAASNYGYEGGYALRALSLHGRFTLNNLIFNIEDRISDFYSKDFSKTEATRLQGGYKSSVFSPESIVPDEICNDRFMIDLMYYRATSEYDRYTKGQTFTMFDDSTLSRVVTYTAYLDHIGRVWWVNGSGIAEIVVPDCSKFQSSCDSPYNYYWTAVDCNSGEKIGTVHTDCILTGGRQYRIDTKQLMPMDFAGYDVVSVTEPAECEPGNNYAVISDCGAAKCVRAR